jgi:hypothetical protein
MTMSTKINPESRPLSKERILARNDRQKGETEKPLDVRIAESTLYDFKPAMRAVLATMARCRVQGDTMNARPNNPLRRMEKISYEDWCWLSQATIAARVGCTERYVEKCIAVFRSDAGLTGPN